MSEATFHLQGGEAEVHNVLGVDHRIIVGSEQTEGAAAVVEIALLPGAGAPPHSEQREALVRYGIEGASMRRRPIASRPKV